MAIFPSSVVTFGETILMWLRLGSAFRGQLPALRVSTFDQHLFAHLAPGAKTHSLQYRRPALIQLA